MHLENVRQVHNNYDHIYLSPHLDDAALSCGGMIARHSSANSRVLVVTICTAVPDAATPFSQLAQECHAKWGLSPEEAVTARLREDILALERIGADSYWAGMVDAMYRMPADYTDNDKLFGTPAAGDPLARELPKLLKALHSRAPHATFYAPLGIGNHVDHQLTCQAALNSAKTLNIAFYEDFPYVTRPGLLEQRFTALKRRFVSSTIDIDAVLLRKIGAVSAYSSQVDDLFGSVELMRQSIMQYAEDLRPDIGTYGERLWLLAAPDLTG